MVHRFKEASFTRPTYCEHCKGLLWGLVRQGVKCSECGYAFHRHCQAAAARCSPNKPQQSGSAASKSLRALQELDAGQTTSESVKEMLVSAAVNASDDSQPSNAYLASMPPLNPQLTARNFSRFVSRCGPIFAFRDNVILLLSWDKPIDTLVALIAYCLICLYPKLILFVPQVALLHVIMQGYKKRSLPVVEPSTPPAPTTTSSVAPAPSTSTPLQTPLSPANKQRNTFVSNFANALSLNLDESMPEYSRNLQNLQNMMGEMSDLHDITVANLHYVDWSSETKTKNLLQGLLLSSIALAIFVYFLPLNLIFLGAGVMVFMLNTRFAKYFIQELTPRMTEMGRAQLSVLVERYEEYEKQAIVKAALQGAIQEVSLFENQLLWAGSGYVPQDEAPWSDITGKVEMQRKEELSAPKGFRWLGTDWKLDKCGPWVDRGQEQQVDVKEGGWVYTDDRAVRRRRWIRQCERLDGKKKTI